MNIPSIESLLSELDKYKRAYESADAQILSLKEQRNRLTDERDGFGKAYHDAYMKKLELTAERDELKAQWAYYQDFCKSHNAKGITDLVVQRDAAMAENAAYYQLAKKEVWAVAETALREAKEALVMNIVGTGGRTPAAHNAIATINKVLGEE